MLRSDEVPSVNLPILPTRVSQPTPRRHLIRNTMLYTDSSAQEESGSIEHCCDVGVNTDMSMSDLAEIERELNSVKEQLKTSRIEYVDEVEKQKFGLKSIGEDDANVRFYTGFTSLSVLMVCYNFLGPAVDNLSYWCSSSSKSAGKEGESKTKKGRKRLLAPLDEFFLLLISLRLGLFEQDLAYQFGVSQSTVSRTYNSNKSHYGLLEL